jgi:outer membrane protein assembly factor BamD
MKLKVVMLSLGCGFWVAGCSSVHIPSMPSLPSLSWSSSANKPDPTAEALFDEGMRYFKDKRYARAIDNFSKIKSDYPFSPLLTQTELQLADAYYLNEQYPEAINAFKEFESMHPTNENIPFVVYRLGQSHFDQFTTTDRDQKNTESAKRYFEIVLAKYPKSPYAADAKEKLARCNGYLAEHDFNIAQFYLKQEKYPAAQARFEEIVRRYRGTPAAAKSLFFLGDSYAKEKNNVKAALAYEALIQHYPDNQFVPRAQAQLAQLKKEKEDPLAMLLMRDRRPSVAVAEESKGRHIDNLVAKTEMVYEEPGVEKGIFTRVVDKINPFSSSGSDKDKLAEKTNSDNTIEQLAKKKAAEDKQQSPGLLASVWHSVNPFAGNEPAPKKAADSSANKTQVVQRIDESLKAKGIDSQVQTAALTPPAIDLPKVEQPPAATSNTAEVISRVDSSLKKDGVNANAVPAAPEAAEVFKNTAAAQALMAKANAAPEPARSVAETGLLSAIDQKLQSQGVKPPTVDLPPAPAANAQASAPKPQPAQKVELEPKVAIEKGPLYLSPTDVPTQETAPSDQEKSGPDKKVSEDKAAADSEVKEIPKALIKGHAQPTVTAASKPAARKDAPAFDDEENKGVLDMLKEDAQNLSKILNPFSW